MDAQIASALIQAGATGVAAAIGFGAIVSQMKRQSRLSREAILDAESRRIRSQMLDEGITAARAVADAAIGFNSALHSARQQIELADLQRARGEQVNFPRMRVPTVMEAHDRLSDDTIKFIFLLENRRIIDERLIVFRDVLNATLHDLRQVYLFGLTGELMRTLPVVLPDGQTVYYDPPGSDQLPAVYNLIDRAVAQGYRLISYMEDFIVEIQNLMLGDIFKKSVSHREPLAAAQIVVRLDRFDAIMKWLDDTPWGKERARYEEQARLAASAENSEQL